MKTSVWLSKVILCSIALTGLVPSQPILASDCSASFVPGGQFRAGLGPGAVAVGDFNADGKLDLVVANKFSANVSVLLGRGDGTFQHATDYGVGVDPLSVAVGDFNGDNRLDLAVANAAIFDTPPSVSILLANANGTFRNATDYSAGVSPRSVAAGDINGDGKLDLAVASYGTSANGQWTNSGAVVLVGTGT